MATLLIRLDPGEQQGRVVDVHRDDFDWNIAAMNADARSPAKFGVVIVATGRGGTSLIDDREDIRRARRVLQRQLPIREQETRDKRGAFRLNVTPAVVQLFRSRSGVVRVPQDVGFKAFFKAFVHRDSAKDMVKHVQDEEAARGVVLDEDTVVARLFDEDRGA